MESPASTQWRSHRLSICLRSVALVASLAGVIAFAYSQDLHDRGIVLTEDLGHHLISPATGTIEYSFIWTLIILSIELSTPLDLHPGLYVAFDFIAWAAVTVGLCLYLAIMQPYYTGDGYTCGRGYRCNGKRVANVEHFGTAMGFLAVLIHFGFFVWACRATDRLRKSRRVSKKAAFVSAAV
ncbi:uncharacterized protein DSM5745_06855 [Aspergillus mulundensis]|uniref:MARVEL domain-containing protein n=1 Tax=Aspergillus mulundensis TaxID=1810919 RepID=A0A3D8RS27_9EURO|nr:Uncharacterized protein DSM5745_06855 [Aspergillus mulundensis]RDW76863.1 Uncharacterized protein DSM5745_06855 [Aspergillus mulundensis]